MQRYIIVYKTFVHPVVSGEELKKMAKVKLQMSQGKMWWVAKWVIRAGSTGDSEGEEINPSPGLTRAINNHSFSAAVTPIGPGLQLEEVSSW